MNQKQMVNAYLTLTQLGSAKLPVTTAYALYQLRKRLEPSHAFCLEQERIILERFEGRLEGDTLFFPNAENAQQAREELNAMNAMDVEYEAEPVKICAEELRATALSMDDIAALDGFVELI